MQAVQAEHGAVVASLVSSAVTGAGVTFSERRQQQIQQQQQLLWWVVREAPIIIWELRAV